MTDKDLKEGLDKVEDAEVTEISEEEMEDVAGGVQDCTSGWCCTSGAEADV